MSTLHRASRLPVLLLASCAVVPPMPAPPPTHPASVSAERAPRTAPSDTLSIPEPEDGR